jgi:two-component system, LuxR family, response regulator FixJ
MKGMSMHENIPTVFVVDDDDGFGASLQWLLKPLAAKIEVLASAAEFLDVYRAGQAGCLILDVHMPLMDGFQLLDAFDARAIRMPVIMITGQGDVPMAVRAMKHGVFDFVQKPFRGAALLELVRAALAHDARERQVRERQSRASASLASLTGREKEVLDLLVTGQTNKMIARSLGIGVRTVETYRATMMTKLQARSVAELMQRVLHLQ